MAPTPNADEIRQALATVHCPGTKVDIVKIDLVHEITAADGRVEVKIRQTSEKDELIAKVCDLVRDKVSSIPGVESVDVGVQKIEAPRKSKPQANPDPWADRESLPGVKRIIAVASGKGGVGKSTVAVNLALALKERGHRVGLMDADIYGPSLPTMLGTDQKPQAIDERAIRPVEAMGLQCISMGMLVPEGQALIWRGPMVMSAVRQFLKDVRWDDLEYLVVDMPPGTGDAQLTLVQQVPVDGVVMVTTPQELALTDVRRGVQMFRHVRVPVTGVVENMSYFICPGCGERADIFGNGGGAEVAEQFGVPLLGQIPLDPATRKGGDSGEPVMLSGDGVSRDAFLDVADKVRASVTL